MTWSPERRATLVGAALVLEGLLSVRIGFAPFEQRQAVLALLTGWFVGGCGLLAWLQVPSSRTGVLLTVAAAAWFIGGFRWVDADAISTIAGALTLLYAAITVHAIATFPIGRTSDRRLVPSIGAAYVAALLAPPLGQVLITAALLVSLAVTPPLALDRSHDRRPAIIVGGVFATALVAGQLLPIVLPGGTRFDFRIVLQLAFMVVAAGLSAALVRDSTRGTRVTDLVVDLDPSRGGLGRELALAIGDPTLEVGYWLPEQRRFVDTAGRAIVLPGTDDARGTTVIEHDATPVAVLIHDPRVSADPAIRAAIARAAELATINARLQSEAREEVLAVDASRRRILQAADDERRDLDTRLREGIEPRLDALEVEIAGAKGQAPETDAMLGEALAELDHTRLDLAGITDGLHPRTLDERGLRGALEALASRGPIPVTLEWLGDEPADATTRTALYFVCSEGLANVTKHGGATHVRVRLTSQETHVVLEIDDDGHGGASLAGGTGLQGLRDRLETLGGSLVVHSPFDRGTHLIARLPVRLER